MAWEFSVLYWFQSIHNDVLDVIVPLVTKLGDGGIFWGIVILLLLILVKDKRVGLTGVLALALDVLICNVILKNVVQRDRPCWLDPSIQLLVESPDDFSFPSGHSAFSFAAATVIVQYYKKWGIAALILAALIAVSRLYLFVHFPTDVICGTMVGIFCGIISGIIVRSYFEKRNNKLMATEK